MVKTMVTQVHPLQPMEVNDGADIHLQPVEDPMPEQMDVPEGRCTLWTSHSGVGLNRFSGSICDPMVDPHLSSLFLKEYILWKGRMLE